MKEKLFIIDGHALCYRAYYAFIKNPLINSAGQNTSAIYGFARMLLNLIYEHQPDYLSIAFDPPQKTFRFDLYSDYKANRQKMPDDLQNQITEIKNMVQILGLPSLEQKNYEADDILGSIAFQYASQDLEIVLVTGDKDAYQLASDKVKIFANKKGISDYEIYGPAEIEKKIGLKPEQIIDYMALIGDASDNIPGVKGIGPKTGVNLIKKYSTLENLYSHLDELKGKQKEYLAKDKEMAFLSRELVTIKKDLKIDLKELKQKLDLDKIRSTETKNYFEKLEMRSIAKDYFSDESQTFNQESKKNRNYKIIQTKKNLEAIIKEIQKAKVVSIDTETTSLNILEAELVGVSFSIKENQGWFIPLAKADLFNQPPEDRTVLIPLLKKVLEDEKIKKIGQNIKFDLNILKNEGINLKGVYFDTMIAAYLVDQIDRRYNLDDLANKYLNYKTITFKELVGVGQKAIPITEVPLETLAEYAIEDTDITFRLYQIFKDKLKEQGVEKIFHEVEIPLIPVLAKMERDGVKIDLAHFEKLNQENSKILDELINKIYALAGEEFNLNSTRELARILFEKLKLPVKKKTKTGYSTDIKVLESLKHKHRIIDLLISYRTLNKLKNTYIEALPKMISPHTKRIHASYNQAAVVTGRLSSSNPNLQNIPIKDNFGQAIREGFIAEKDFQLMSADYSQIELRIAAHISKDPNMLQAFQEETDIHSLTASSIFNVSLEKVSEQMRRQAKIVNFSIIYGISAYGLSEQIGISVREAAHFIEKYLDSYPGFKNYLAQQKKYAQENGYVKTLLGRKRSIPEINSTASFRREGAERIAVNTPIQGTSADMIKVAMINIDQEFKKLNFKSKIIIQVHDELLFEVYNPEKKTVEKIVKAKMENSLKLDVPVLVDIGWGPNWDQAH